MPHAHQKIHYQHADQTSSLPRGQSLMTKIDSPNLSHTFSGNASHCIIQIFSIPDLKNQPNTHSIYIFFLSRSTSMIIQIRKSAPAKIRQRTTKNNNKNKRIHNDILHRDQFEKMEAASSAPTMKRL